MEIPTKAAPAALVSVDVSESGIQPYYVRVDSDAEVRAGLNLLARVCPELRALDSRAKTNSDKEATA
jgi:hypothetical protein